MRVLTSLEKDNKRFIVKRNMYKKIARYVEGVLSLLVVFLLLMAATLWTGRLFGREIGGEKFSVETSGVGASTTTDVPTPEQLKQLSLNESDVQLTPRDSASWTVVGGNGEALGVVITTAPYASDVKGFAGPTPLYIYVSKEGTIKQIIAAENADKPNFFNRAFTSLAPQWRDKSMEQAAALKVDAVSGATFSSNAIIANVQRTLTAQVQSETSSSLRSPMIGWGRTIAVAVVLLLGIIVNLKWRGRKWLRLTQLVLNVAVLGFWCGQFLSLSLLRGWISNGLDPVAYLPTLLVLIVALVMPFFKHKHHYCSWICPLGSLQTLAAELPLPKVHCSPKVYRVMSRVRLYVFALLMLLLWTAFWAGSVLDYEPFTAFFVTAAAPAVMILAAAIVIASCFVPNVWCKSLCPMGMALTLAEDSSAVTVPSKKNSQIKSK